MNLTHWVWNDLFIFFLLVGLELVLGIDNILVISLLVAPLPDSLRQRARLIGLSLAFIFRLGCVMGACWLVRWTTPLLYRFSAKDGVLILGGFFIILKALQELYELTQGKGIGVRPSQVTRTVSAIVLQIVVLDFIFSLDSVITAVGLTTHFFIIFMSVLFSFIGLLFYVGPVGDFILRHRSLKIVALAFLLILGASFIGEGFSYHLDKSIIYSALGSALLVEFLQQWCRSYNKHS